MQKEKCRRLIGAIGVLTTGTTLFAACGQESERAQPSGRSDANVITTAGPCRLSAMPTAELADGSAAPLLPFDYAPCDPKETISDNIKAFGFRPDVAFATVTGSLPVRVHGPIGGNGSLTVPEVGLDPSGLDALFHDRLPTASPIKPDATGVYVVGPPTQSGCRVLALNLGGYPRPGGRIVLLMWNATSAAACILRETASTGS